MQELNYLKLINKKMKMLIGFCLSRICQDGLIYLLPFMHKRNYYVNEKFFIEILSKKEIKYDEISDEELKI